MYKYVQRLYIYFGGIIDIACGRDEYLILGVISFLEEEDSDSVEALLEIFLGIILIT